MGKILIGLLITLFEISSQSVPSDFEKPLSCSATLQRLRGGGAEWADRMLYAKGGSVLGESRVRSFERTTNGRLARDNDLLEFQDLGDSDDHHLLRNVGARSDLNPQLPSPADSSGEADCEDDEELARRLQDHENGQVRRPLALSRFAPQIAKGAEKEWRGREGIAGVLWDSFLRL
jgi:hypothetical protein